ncbi:biopolymer transporter ExbD [Pseudomonas luteola]|uniref:ExbD/TolR family protein n=1 Tax=Pseudomonas luteola TaxID=47886 RepID=UPI000F76D0E3|nr:biopolymer transporter ExbD [Pseudomonas luteola]RRW47322.1 biopolymer transporter ExbD [Pseudomonas luteola]
MSFSTQDSDEVLSEMNVTPLVDVMLVLLVVFIVTAPLMTNAIKVNLPKTDAVAPAEQKAPVIVSVDKDGKFYLDKSELQPELLETSLKDVKAKDPEVRVRLQADEGVNYGQVAKAMASIERSGITRIAVMTSR